MLEVFNTEPTMTNEPRTANEMVIAIGHKISVRFETLTVGCEVKDVKNSYGRVRLLVGPLNGTGEQWIEMGRVKLPAVGALARS